MHFGNVWFFRNIGRFTQASLRCVRSSAVLESGKSEQIKRHADFIELEFSTEAVNPALWASDCPLK